MCQLMTMARGQHDGHSFQFQASVIESVGYGMTWSMYTHIDKAAWAFCVLVAWQFGIRSSGRAIVE